VKNLIRFAKRWQILRSGFRSDVRKLPISLAGLASTTILSDHSALNK